MNHNLANSLHIRNVEINVADLVRMREFYHRVMGLDILTENLNEVILGKNNVQLLTLHHRRELSPPHATHAGLYHFAILFSSRGDLARTIYRIIKQTPHLFSGSADHLVSEAFYFNDPEGNGIELYYDRDKATWQWKNGAIKMGALYIDPNDYLQRNIVLEEKNTEVKMGHIHLKVGNIEKAKKFYKDILGFTVTAELPGALFISVGGYHHHIGMNTWESEGATERTESLGLKNFELVLPKKENRTDLKKRLEINKVSFEEREDSLILHDPWKNKITITSSL